MNDSIGFDTSVALRWLVSDPANPTQSRLAVAIAEDRADPIHINLVVLAEMIWLAAKSIKTDRAQQAGLIRGLLGHRQVQLAERDAVVAALAEFENGGAGFSDHLIAALNRAAGCATTLTFDKSAARSPGFTLLA